MNCRRNKKRKTRIYFYIDILERRKARYVGRYVAQLACVTALLLTRSAAATAAAGFDINKTKKWFLPNEVSARVCVCVELAEIHVFS